MSELVVVDTNILISALISGNEDILRTLSTPDISFVTASFAVVELFEHSPRIQERSHLPREQLLDLLALIVGRVGLRNDGIISLGTWVEASRLCRGVDSGDIPFVALALELKGRLWTRDKRLKNHLIRNGFSEFFDLTFGN